MTGATSAHDLDAALQSMASSQHTLLKQVEPIKSTFTPAPTSRVLACSGI